MYYIRLKKENEKRTIYIWDTIEGFESMHQEGGLIQKFSVRKGDNSLFFKYEHPKNSYNISEKGLFDQILKMTYEEIIDKYPEIIYI